MNKLFKHITLSIVLMIFSVTFSPAQSIVAATLEWKAAQAMNMQTGEMIENPGVIITTGRNAVEWRKDDGSIRYSFTVSEVIGTWVNVNKTGSITYEVAGEGGNGTATFLRTSEGINIRILLTKEGEQQLFELTNIVLQVL
jgi:hypothetical protein